MHTRIQTYTHDTIQELHHSRPRQTGRHEPSHPAHKLHLRSQGTSRHARDLVTCKKHVPTGRTNPDFRAFIDVYFVYHLCACALGLWEARQCEHWCRIWVWGVWCVVAGPCFIGKRCILCVYVCVCMCVCVYTFMLMCNIVYVYVYVCVCVYVCLSLSLSLSLSGYAQVCNTNRCGYKHAYKCIHTYMNVHTCIHTYINTCMNRDNGGLRRYSTRNAYIYMYIYIYIYIYTYIHNYIHEYRERWATAIQYR